MKKILFLLALTAPMIPKAQESNGWIIEAKSIDPNNYYGVTVANGMIGLISSAEPMKVKDVVLNGAFDLYGRGRVDNILKGFNFVNMNLDVDNQRVGAKNISSLRQYLDMHQAVLVTEFDFQDKVHVKYSLAALRHLPFTALIQFEIVAKKDTEVTPASVIESPDILKEVKNTYAVIDRPHVKLPLMTSVGKSPSGKHTVAASTSFIFEKNEIPALVHEDWDYNMHLTKFSKKLKAGEKFSFCVVGSVISTAHIADPVNEAERLTIFAMLEGRERLLRGHTEAWEELWKSDVVIGGDPQAQRDIRFAIYHLYSFARAGTAYSLSPMGLSGLGLQWSCFLGYGALDVSSFVGAQT